MRALIQRVSRAQVSISGQIKGKIGGGLLIFLGIEAADTDEDILWLVRKITQLRIFNDAEGVMNLSLLDVGGEALVISQFTLQASTKKGNRPSYIRAARPEIAIPHYEAFLKAFTTALGKQVASGTFGADMQVELLNDGPVTLWIDSKNRE